MKTERIREEEITEEILKKAREIMGQKKDDPVYTGPASHENFGVVSVSIWEETFSDKHTRELCTDFKTTIERRYKDKEGEWKGSNQYFRRQLFDLRMAVDWAIQQMHELGKQQKNE